MSDEQDPLLNQPQRATSPEFEELEHELVSLRGAITSTLLGLLLLSIGVNAFMWRQVRIVRTQLHEEKEQVARYQQAEPAIRDFLGKLQRFADSNPDFKPILAKYAPPSTNAAPSPSTTPKH